MAKKLAGKLAQRESAAGATTRFRFGFRGKNNLELLVTENILSLTPIIREALLATRAAGLAAGVERWPVGTTKNEPGTVLADSAVFGVTGEDYPPGLAATLFPSAGASTNICVIFPVGCAGENTNVAVADSTSCVCSGSTTPIYYTLGSNRHAGGGTTESVWVEVN